MMLKRLFPYIFVCLLSLSFFIPALMQGKILLPADTIVGLYHPYRDFYADEYQNGIPYKNFLITDPVRQQFPWKLLSTSLMREGRVPSWNPYTFSGTPLAAGFQTGAWYPVNILFFIFPTLISWNIYILLQPVLGSLFLFLYLRNLKLSQFSSLFGSFVFAYSGFAVAWLEWGNIFHTALWLPLVLLSIDKVCSFSGHTLISNFKFQILHFKIKINKTLIWSVVFILALTNSFFAGHLQTFFYLSFLTLVYCIARWVQYGKQWKAVLLFSACFLLIATLTFIQWFPTWQYILESARSVDQSNWQIDGWFIPWQHVIQFIAPDFFGNPTTLNYSGVWNYGEFIGYVGLIPLIMSLLAILTRRDKKTYFYAGVLCFSCLFAFPTFIAKIPYLLSVPFLSTAQPTRLLFVINFSLAVLSALGFDYVTRSLDTMKKKIILSLGLFLLIFILLWNIVLVTPSVLSFNAEQVAVAMRNMQLPTLLFVITTCIMLLMIKIKNERLRLLLFFCLGILTLVDLLRFTGKFIPMTDPSYAYPNTMTTSFLRENLGHDRYLTLDSRILPPNFSIMYKLQTVEGYDPLYLRRYGELIIASERSNPDITPPFGFNRILTPHTYPSSIINVLGTKYILTLSDLSLPGVTEVFREGETRVYENTHAFPRAFFVSEIVSFTPGDKEGVMAFLFHPEHDLKTKAAVEGNLTKVSYASGSAEIIEYAPDTVRIKTTTTGDAFLVLTDAYYPTWKAKILDSDGSYLNDVEIYRTDYHFRGIVVPDGTHIVEFSNTLL